MCVLLTFLPIWLLGVQRFSKLLNLPADLFVMRKLHSADDFLGPRTEQVDAVTARVLLNIALCLSSAVVVVTPQQLEVIFGRNL